MHSLRSVLSRSAVCRTRRQPGGRLGFTLLELLLVLAILVMIVGIVGMNLGNSQTEANINVTKTQIGNVKSALQMYRIRMNTLPDTLEALRDGPSDSEKKAKWVGAIMDEIPTDAWGNALTYKKNGNQYEIRSAGIDGQSNTDDDIVVEGS